MDDDLKQYVELAKVAKSEDELNQATLKLTDRSGHDVTPKAAKYKLRELKLRILLKYMVLRLFNRREKADALRRL